MSHEHGGGGGSGGSKAGEGAPLASESTSVFGALGFFIFGWLLIIIPSTRDQSLAEMQSAQA